jgi:diguanylate cyclase (GGDEF)-like protein
MSESVKTLLHMAENAYYRESKFNKALEFLTEAISIEATSVRAFLLKGMCETRLLQYPKAVNSFNTALKHDLNNVEALLNLAYINIQVGDYEQAKDFIKRALNIKSVSEAFELLGDIAHINKLFKEAIDYYEQAIQLAPTNDGLYHKKGICHGALRQFKDAIQCSELAYELNNKNIEAKNFADEMSDDYFSKGRGLWAGILLKIQKPYLREKLRDEMQLFDAVKRAQKLSDELSWDPAFKIRTKAFFDTKYNVMVNEAQENNLPICVLLLDIDNMKIFNETYGHRIVNQMLGHSGDFMNQLITEKDLAARWGGDELIMVLQNTDKKTAKSLYDKFRALIDNLNATTAKDLGVKGEHKFSFSIGLACAPMDMENIGQSWSDQLFDKADLAVKMAKLNGKDQLVTFDLSKKAEWLAKRAKAAAEDKAKVAKGERPT